MKQLIKSLSSSLIKEGIEPNIAERTATRAMEDIFKSNPFIFPLKKGVNAIKSRRRQFPELIVLSFEKNLSLIVLEQANGENHV